MRWSYNLERSRSVATWLLLVALMVVAMVVVGGMTRLTGSGLSITQWKPISGALPPLDAHAWQAEFARYQAIPQYRLINPDMTLAQFKFIYGWEWAHRLLGRLVGLVYFLPFIGFLVIGKIPRRLIWRCWVIAGVGLLEPLVGWWMVASGLSERVSVAPERLVLHLGIALLLYGLCVWTGWEAWSGRPRSAEHFAPPRWIAWASALAPLVYLQMLLGALVAGNQAGRVDTDWPLMNGRLIPSDYAARGGQGRGLWATLVHNPSAVQFNHRLVGYVVFALAVALAATVLSARRAPTALKQTAAALGIAVTGQLVLGVATVMAAAPLGLSAAHQVWAMVLFTSTLLLAWRMRRS